MLFLCGPAERDSVRDICRRANHPHVRSLADQKLSVGLTKACVRRSRLMVTTDSGPRHIAAAFGVPTVTLFGPTDPRWSHNYHPTSIDLHLDLPCSPCGDRICPLKHHRCMRELTVEHVMAAANALLDSGHRYPRRLNRVRIARGSCQVSGYGSYGSSGFRYCTLTPLTTCQPLAIIAHHFLGHLFVIERIDVSRDQQAFAVTRDVQIAQGLDRAAGQC